MKRSDMFNALIKAQDELKKQGKDEWNISALSELTGVSRPTIRKFRDSGREVPVHGNTGRKKPVTKLTGFEARIDAFLKSGCSNSSKILEELKKDGYTGSQTTIKDYISAHRELIPVRVDPKPVTRARRYETLPGDAMQMDWGFVNAMDRSGVQTRLACFVMVCCHCRKPYIEFFTCARQEFLLIGMIHAFHYFGGLPKFILNLMYRHVIRSFYAVGISNTIVDRINISRKFGNVKTLNAPYSSLTRSQIILKVLSEPEAKYPFFNILLGHSGHKTEHHLEILKKLERFKDENLMIYIPLSYGDSEYIESVKKQIDYEIWGNIVNVIDELMAFEDYIRFLKKMNFAIIDVQGSAALGNIGLLRMLGKTLCVNREGLVHLDLIQAGLSHFTTDELTNVSFNDLCKPVHTIHQSKKGYRQIP